MSLEKSRGHGQKARKRFVLKCKTLNFISLLQVTWVQKKKKFYDIDKKVEIPQIKHKI